MIHRKLQNVVYMKKIDVKKKKKKKRGGIIESCPHVLVIPPTLSILNLIIYAKRFSRPLTPQLVSCVCGPRENAVTIQWMSSICLPCKTLRR